MQREYIEIVHVGPGMLELYEKICPKNSAIVRRIQALARERDVVFNYGFLGTDPDLPKETPIRLGGALWEICVNYRADKLRKMGYLNVTPDRRISFSKRDSFEHTGFKLDPDRREL